MKKILFVLLCCFCFLSCEDKKKSPQLIEPIIKEDTVKIPQSIIDKLNRNEVTDPLLDMVTLTDATVEEFLMEYGKENPERFVTLETNLGDIKLELFNNTPIHRAHFIYLVKNGYLNTTVFHRVVDNFMIQGGNSDRMETSRMRRRMGNYTLPAEIIHRHNRGALASAKEYRDNPDDRSAPFEFYIVQSHNGAHHLNPHYTVFGKVLTGIQIVDTIASLETDEGDWPLDNVFIKALITD
jgi:peptidyl-prolyl cis-trans isomerase A (cyclophilin A)